MGIGRIFHVVGEMIMRKTKPNSKWLARRKMFKHDYVKQKESDLKLKINQFVRQYILYNQLYGKEQPIYESLATVATEDINTTFKHKHLQKTKVSHKIARTLVCTKPNFWRQNLWQNNLLGLMSTK